LGVFEDVGRQVAIVVTTWAVVLAGPFTAIAFMLWRKRKLRKQKRSPLTVNLLRTPGHTLREQIEDLRGDILWDLAMMMAIPPTVVTFLFMQATFGRASSTRVIVILSVCVAAFIAVMVWRLLRASRKLDRSKAGYDAELSVGQELQQLMRQGAAVFHDIPGGEFNIDHVVVSERGVYTVETKGYTKPQRAQGTADARVVVEGASLVFPTWRSSKPLEQAQRQAEWLDRELSRLSGVVVRSQPVLALPGWFVEDKGSSSAVWVVSGRALRSLLKRRGPRTLSADEVERIAYQVEQRCRTVAPTFGGDRKSG
jgi:hypothetical protein